MSWNWGQNFLFYGLGALTGLAVAHFYYERGKRDSEESYKALQHNNNKLLGHNNALFDKVTALSQQTQELLQKVGEITQELIAMHSSDQPVPQEQVKSFSGKVEAVTATAMALEISVSDVVKFSEEVTGKIIYPYEQFPNGKKPK